MPALEPGMPRAGAVRRGVMGFRLVRVEVITLQNPEEARKAADKLRGYGGTDCEREDKAVRKGKIRDKLFHDELLSFDWRVGKVLPAGPERRVDGQHSSEVFLELTPEDWQRVRFPLTVVWSWYECDTLRDLPNLFEQFNPPWSTRDAKDIMGAHLGIQEDLRGTVNRHLGLKGVTGLLWFKQNVNGEKLTKGSKFQIVHDNGEIHAFLVWAASLLSAPRVKNKPGKSEEMLLPPVIAAMFLTTRHDEAARDFWRLVGGGKRSLAFDADTPMYKLAEFLEMNDDKFAIWPEPWQRHF